MRMCPVLFSQFMNVALCGLENIFVNIMHKTSMFPPEHISQKHLV